MDLSIEQSERYHRHILLDGVGAQGQQKIINGSVLVIGVGGLGSPCALYLGASGVGTLGLVDGDIVDKSNLHRQVVHFDNDVDKPKVISAQEKINQINPQVNVVTYQKKVFADNIADIISEYDFVIDATDNFEAKFLINDACILNDKPFSHGGILGYEGQAMTYVPGGTCYRCVFGDVPPQGTVPTCAEVGVLGSVPGILGSIQSTEALKYLTGAGDLLTDRMLIFDALNVNFRTIKLKPNKDCKVCGDNPSVMIS